MLRAPQIHQLVRDGALQLSLFDERDLDETASPDYPGERLIVCRNPLRGQDQIAQEAARWSGNACPHRNPSSVFGGTSAWQRLAAPISKGSRGRRTRAETRVPLESSLEPATRFELVTCALRVPYS